MPDFTFSSKFSPATKLHLSQMSDSDKESVVEIMMRTRSRLTDDQKTDLNSMGVELRTEAGDILTASVKTVSLPILADLDFVISIEIATNLFPDSR